MMILKYFFVCEGDRLQKVMAVGNETWCLKRFPFFSQALAMWKKSVLVFDDIFHMRHSFDIGVDDYILKPVQLKRVLKALERSG